MIEHCNLKFVWQIYYKVTFKETLERLILYEIERSVDIFY